MMGVHLGAASKVGHFFHCDMSGNFCRLKNKQQRNQSAFNKVQER